ncbi:hypothetical protein ACN27F_23905 [Solwaraspora sp. WMMB335]|uniref:hypothetical protein n=1 Tax=Solwaraspora sp. WMMB335 TaxID=3404118 RepID=UPI003B9405BA
MPAGPDTSPVTQSTVGTWIARWTVGAALGQIVFGGTVRLILAVIMGALLGGLAVWLFQRHRPSLRLRRPAAASTRPTAAHAAARSVPVPPHAATTTSTGNRIRYSPLAPPRR